MLFRSAKLNITIAGVTLQPSEIVKIIFVFFVASCIYKKTDIQTLIKTAAVSAVFVLVLVFSKDLGSAMIFYVIFVVMVTVAAKRVSLLFAGTGMGAIAAVAGYFLFNHVRVRVAAWRDPLSDVSGAGYQVSQSLFAIGTGGWFGSGIYGGMPEKIPVVTTDFVFAAICEEFES